MCSKTQNKVSATRLRHSFGKSKITFYIRVTGCERGVSVYRIRLRLPIFLCRYQSSMSIRENRCSRIDGSPEFCGICSIQLNYIRITSSQKCCCWRVRKKKDGRGKGGKYSPKNECFRSWFTELAWADIVPPSCLFVTRRYSYPSILDSLIWTLSLLSPSILSSNNKCSVDYCLTVGSSSCLFTYLTSCFDWSMADRLIDRLSSCPPVCLRSWSSSLCRRGTG